MSTEQAEVEARQFVNRVIRHSSGNVVSPADYERAVQKAARSFDRLHEAVRLAEQNQSKS
jgi:hypothetical protein